MLRREFRPSGYAAAVYAAALALCHGASQNRLCRTSLVPPVPAA
jgi:hypothetical protein